MGKGWASRAWHSRYPDKDLIEAASILPPRLFSLSIRENVLRNASGVHLIADTSHIPFYLLYL